MDVFVTMLAAIGILFIGFIFGAIFGILKTKLEAMRILDVYAKLISTHICSDSEKGAIKRAFIEMYEKITKI